MSVLRSDPARPVSAAYAALVSQHALTDDPLQRQAARVLDRVAMELTEGSGGGFLGRFFSKPQVVRGAYLVGAVGRGKTMLMDLFFAAVATEKKRRVHYHEFMDEMHEAIAAFRASPRGKAENSDPVEAVTRPLIAGTRLLCLDEFHVQDITNAMLLGRLFAKLFEAGVVLVATSNTPPQRLYENGLNRELFLPFVAMLERQCEIVELDGPTDYRRLKFEGEEVYRFGAGPEVEAEMDRLWLRLTGGVAGEPATLTSLGRSIAVPRAAMGAARFGFAELCERPLGARDYLKLAHAYDTIVVDGVPQFDRTRSDASKRFILLIDTLYDRGVRFAASFAAPLDELGRDDRTRAEFARTASRLIEMQSADYLSAPRRPESTEIAAPSTLG